MKGIKAHPHRDRQKVIDEMVPLIKRRFGPDLLGLLVSGCRGEWGHCLTNLKGDKI